MYTHARPHARTPARAHARTSNYEAPQKVNTMYILL